jgi:hypothetical protein
MSDAADLVGDVIECIKYGFKEGGPNSFASAWCRAEACHQGL